MSNTKSSLTQQNTNTYPSNTSGSITANSVKSFNNNFINAVATLGDTNVFTEPQTFGNTVQVNSNVIANNFVGPLIGTASWAINALTASFALNASSAITASLITTASSVLNTITFTKGDASTFNLTVDTGSGIGFMNLGANTFTGSQTIQSASLFLQGSSSIALNTNFFTASTAGAIDGANIYLFAGSANSGSVAISGSRNIGTISQQTNSQVPTRFAGFSGSGNFGIFANTYSTASRAPILTNNFIVAGINHLMTNTGSISTLSSNFIGGAITITGSSLTANTIANNSIDNVTIENNFSGSGASQNISVSNNIIKGNSGTGVALIKFGSSTINTNGRAFTNNLVVGTNITASLEQLNGIGGIGNTAIIGSGLIVSGTMPSAVSGNQLSASMFVGKFNSTASFYPNLTASLADPTQVVFGVGSGTSNTARKTSLYVSASGLTVMTDNAWVSGTLTVEQDTDGIALQLSQKTGGGSTWQIIQGGSIDTSTNICINATHNFKGDGNNLYRFDTPVTINRAFIVSGSTTITGSVNILGSATATSFTGSLQGTASWANNAVSASYSNNATSASYALIATSASFAPSAPAFPFTGSAQVSGTLAFSGSLIGNIDAGVPLIVNFGDNTITNPGANGRNFTFGTAITNASVNNGAAFGESHNLQTPSYNSFIGGGNGNTINANKVFIGGGTSNSVTAVEGAIIGGSSNSVSHQASVILGGSGMSSTQANEVQVPHLKVTGSLAVTGDVRFASGSNKTMGTAVLDGANPGAVVVSNSLVTTSSLIFLTKQTLNHTNGYVAISSKGSSTFTITSNHNGDTDTVAYLIINPA